MMKFMGNKEGDRLCFKCGDWQGPADHNGCSDSLCQYREIQNINKNTCHYCWYMRCDGTQRNCPGHKCKYLAFWAMRSVVGYEAMLRSKLGRRRAPLVIVL
jgi:hypothetical protein